MKRLLLLVMFVVASVAGLAQNVQLHYDFGRGIYDELGKTEDYYGRPQLTTTVEMFRPDSFGSTFFFIDLDYASGVKGAYWEIAREFCFWQDSKVNWLSVHVEYNGGLNTVAGSFNNAILGGLTYSGHSKDWSKTWSLTASYKAIPGTIGLNGERQVNNFQITGVWNLDFFDHWLSFNGFADFWREARPWQGTEYIFIAEPQLWVNLNKIKGWDKINLSLGTEVELSSNFVQKGFSIMPTIAAKWIF